MAHTRRTEMGMGILVVTAVWVLVLCSVGGVEAVQCVKRSKDAEARSPPPVQAPPYEEGADGPIAARMEFERVCEEGYVPALSPLMHSRKGRPALPTRKEHTRTAASSTASSSAVSYFYTSGYSYTTATSLSCSVDVAAPVVKTARGHSLAELSAEKYDARGRQVVEVGWTVDTTDPSAHAVPRLFVFHWVNDVPSCYNGCGFVQYSSSVWPGMPMSVNSTADFSLEYHDGAWWVALGKEVIGYFPESLWTAQGASFSATTLVQCFGEVAADTPPLAQMGNGEWGQSPFAVAFSNMFVRRQGYSGTSWMVPSYLVTATSYYDIGRRGTNHGYSFGGPGAL